MPVIVVTKGDDGRITDVVKRPADSTYEKGMQSYSVPSLIGQVRKLNPANALPALVQTYELVYAIRQSEHLTSEQKREFEKVITSATPLDQIAIEHVSDVPSIGDVIGDPVSDGPGKAKPVAVIAYFIDP